MPNRTKKCEYCGTPKKWSLRDGGKQRKRLLETVKVKEKSPQGRWKAKKKALGDGGSQRKKVSERVKVNLTHFACSQAKF